jgi:hypothetical protein
MLFNFCFMKTTDQFFLTYTYGFEHSSFSGVGLQAHPLVSSVPACTLLHGLVDDPSIDLPHLFTVVPIFSMTISTFASLSHVPQNNVTDIQLFALIRNLSTGDKYDIEAFRSLPRLLVVGSDDEDVPDTFVSGHCASKALCFKQNNCNPAALLTSHRCPGCAQGVHEECGYYNLMVEDENDEITCLSFFNKFGQVLGTADDPGYIPKKKVVSLTPQKTLLVVPDRSNQLVGEPLSFPRCHCPRKQSVLIGEKNKK